MIEIWSIIPTGLHGGISFFISIATKMNLRNFLIIMPYLRHIVEQPMDRLYFILLISLKIKLRII